MFRRRQSAQTVVEVLVVIGVLLVLLGLLIVYGGRSASAKSRRIHCVGNLKHIGLAFRIFAIDHNDQFPMHIPTNSIGSFESLKMEEILPYWRAISNELTTPKLLVCPSDKRQEATNFAKLRLQNVCYFLGLDAAGNRPQALLAGDRNLTSNGVPVQTGLLPLTTNLILGWQQGFTSIGATSLLVTAACSSSATAGCGMQ